MRIILTILLALTLLSCKDLFQYSPNEVRLEDSEKNLNQKNILKIQALTPSSHFRFILLGDSQRFYEEMDDFVASVNAQDDVAFVVLAGDISDFGLNKEFRWMQERLNHLKMPYIGVIGNHDMLANGREVYHQMFGAENFFFSYGSTRFICLNTNSRERGNDGSIPDLGWLSNVLADTLNYQKAFVIGHIPPFSVDFNRDMEPAYAHLLASSKRVLMSLHGHEHKYSRTSPYGDGVDYLVIGSMDIRNYALISVEENGYHVEIREF